MAVALLCILLAIAFQPCPAAYIELMNGRTGLPYLSLRHDVRDLVRKDVVFAIAEQDHMDSKVMKLPDWTLHLCNTPDAIQTTCFSGGNFSQMQAWAADPQRSGSSSFYRSPAVVTHLGGSIAEVVDAEPLSVGNVTVCHGIREDMYTCHAVHWVKGSEPQLWQISAKITPFGGLEERVETLSVICHLAALHPRGSGGSLPQKIAGQRAVRVLQSMEYICHLNFPGDVVFTGIRGSNYV